MRPSSVFVVVSVVVLLLAMVAVRFAGKRLRADLGSKSPGDPLSDLTKAQLTAILRHQLATPMDLAKMRPSERAMLAVAAMRLESGAPPR